MLAERLKGQVEPLLNQEITSPGQGKVGLILPQKQVAPQKAKRLPEQFRLIGQRQEIQTMI